MSLQSSISQQLHNTIANNKHLRKKILWLLQTSLTISDCPVLREWKSILYSLYIAQLNAYDRLHSSLLFHSITSEPYKRYGLHLVLTIYCNTGSLKLWQFEYKELKHWKNRTCILCILILKRVAETKYQPRYFNSWTNCTDDPPIEI